MVFLLSTVAVLFALFVYLQKDTAITTMGSYIGDFVLILALFSFSLWYINRFLRKKKDRLVFAGLQLVKKYHIYLGLIVWLLISVHGFYFLFVSDLRHSPDHVHHMSHSIRTGIVAYILLTLLIVLGLWLKISPRKIMKTFHTINANVLLFIVYLHIGGWVKVLLAFLLIGHWAFLGMSCHPSTRS